MHRYTCISASYTHAYNHEYQIYETPSTHTHTHTHTHTAHTRSDYVRLSRWPDNPTEVSSYDHRFSHEFRLILHYLHVTNYCYDFHFCLNISVFTDFCISWRVLTGWNSTIISFSMATRQEYFSMPH